MGKDPVIIDPRDRTFPGWVHRELGKRAVREGRLSAIDWTEPDYRRWDNLASQAVARKLGLRQFLTAVGYS